MAELREVLRFPEHLRQISAEVRVPVQMTLGDLPAHQIRSKEKELFKSLNKPLCAYLHCK